MNSEEFKAIYKSLARIELLLKTMIEAQYGEKNAKRVYGEVVNVIDKELFKEDTDND